MAKDRVNKFANIVMRETPIENSKEVMKELVHHEIKNSELRFDYSKLKINDEYREELIGIERELKHHQDRFIDLSIDMGRALSNAREIFIKSHSESFIEWYESLGFNKSQVSALVNKYKLLVDYPEKEKNIIILTDKQVLEITNKKTPEYIKERIILQGENISAAEIRRERQKNISIRVEIFPEDIQEAEIIIDYEVSVEKEFEEIMEVLSQVEKNIEPNKNNLETLIKIKGMLKGLNRIVDNNEEVN